MKRSRRRQGKRRAPPVIVHATLSFDGRVLDGHLCETWRDTPENVSLDRRTLADLLALLAQHFAGVKRFACAGGTPAARQLLAAGLVDEIHLTLHPQIVGGGNERFPTLNGTRTAGSDALFPASQAYRLLSMRVIARRCHLRYARINAKVRKVAANTNSRSTVLAAK